MPTPMVRLKFLKLTGGAAITAAAFGVESGGSVVAGATITLPSNPLHGMVAIAVEVHPTKNLEGVELFVDNHSIGVDFTTPYAFPWDTKTVADGTHVVRADAVYKNRRHSATLTVVVTNAAITLFPNATLYPTDTLTL
jgi:hypothetical protein